MSGQTDRGAEVEAAMAAAHPVAKADYLRWARNGNLATRARVYRLSATAWERIRPSPTMSEQCTFMADYLLECLLANPVRDEFVHGGFEAGREIAAWLKHLSTIAEAGPVVEDVARRLGIAFKAGDAATRNRIETGALEHALESARVRRFFEDWARDPVLRNAYASALQWGLAHSED
jgi:hypothetical protein